MKLAQPEPILEVILRLQAVLRGTPPPWLRKAMRKGEPAPHDFDDELNHD